MSFMGGEGVYIEGIYYGRTFVLIHKNDVGVSVGIYACIMILCMHRQNKRGVQGW